MCTAFGACADKSANAAKRISYIIGIDGTIVGAYSEVSAGSHAEDVLADLGK